jgi:hypothetical protein
VRSCALLVTLRRVMIQILIVDYNVVTCVQEVERLN